MKNLESVKRDLTPIKLELLRLGREYHGAGHERIAHEIRQAARALEEPIDIAELYLSGESLPSVEDVQRVYRTIQAGT